MWLHPHEWGLHERTDILSFERTYSERAPSRLPRHADADTYEFAKKKKKLVFLFNTILPITAQLYTL